MSDKWIFTPKKGNNFPTAKSENMRNLDKSDVAEGLTLGAAIVGIGLVAVLLFCSLYLYMAWASALVGVKLWAWFIVPVFGLKALTLSQAFGISLLLSFWTYHYRSSFKSCKEQTDGEKWAEVLGLLCYPWMVLFIGWICHIWFMAPLS